MENEKARRETAGPFSYAKCRLKKRIVRPHAKSAAGLS
jgi:hypothetical protein